MKKDIIESLNIYFENIDEAVKVFTPKDKIVGTTCYDKGFEKLGKLLEQEYKDRYKTFSEYRQRKGGLSRQVEIFPHIFIKNSTENKRVMPIDGIYIYIELSTSIKERKIMISLELGKRKQYYGKDDVYNERLEILQKKYQKELDELTNKVNTLGKNNELEGSILAFDFYEPEKILEIIEEFSNTYDKIIKDIESYQLEIDLWGKNWEKFQKDIFKENLMSQEETAFNRIYYGIPGCGKSYLVNEIEFSGSNYDIVRTTFHPEYTSSDFLGQIIPKINSEKQAYYDIDPGPFTKILLEAIQNERKKYCLIIEEINRGNAPAIFGDLLSILDRDPSGETRKSYGINNYIIEEYFKKNGILDSRKIRIPKNLWIIGTMNTSDQSIFSLDTAFKRRWEWRYVPNEFKDNDLAWLLIPGTNITWKTFNETVNKKIREEDQSFLSSEDKQLGVYFVSEKELVNPAEDYHEKNILEKQTLFAEKVLMYLWDDVARINRQSWFPQYNSFAEVLKDFNKKGLDVLGSMFQEMETIDEP